MKLDIVVVDWRTWMGDVLDLNPSSVYAIIDTPVGMPGYRRLEVLYGASAPESLGYYTE